MHHGCTDVSARSLPSRAFTFDDVLLIPAESDVLPADIGSAHPAHPQNQA
ncbi:MAG: hypothetical protein ACLRWQ_18780 [Flavonifractor plautii]